MILLAAADGRLTLLGNGVAVVLTVRALGFERRVVARVIYLGLRSAGRSDRNVFCERHPLSASIERDIPQLIAAIVLQVETETSVRAQTGPF